MRKISRAGRCRSRTSAGRRPRLREIARGRLGPRGPASIIGALRAGDVRIGRRPELATRGKRLCKAHFPVGEILFFVGVRRAFGNWGLARGRTVTGGAHPPKAGIPDEQGGGGLGPQRAGHTDGRDGHQRRALAEESAMIQGAVIAVQSHADAGRSGNLCDQGAWKPPVMVFYVISNDFRGPGPTAWGPVTPRAQHWV